MTYDELLKAFSEKLGGGVDLTPDESGAVVLDVDEMQVSIMGLEEVGQVVLTGVVGEPPPEDHLERLYKSILEANHNFVGTFGATLSIDPENGNVGLCKSIPLSLADGDSFFTDVEHFINVLETWRRLVEDFRAIADAPSDTPSGDTPSAGGLDGLGGFMQV